MREEEEMKQVEQREKSGAWIIQKMWSSEPQTLQHVGRKHASCSPGEPHIVPPPPPFTLFVPSLSVSSSLFPSSITVCF